MNANTLSETDADSSGDAQDPFCEDGDVGGNEYFGQPVIKTREEHSISRRDIDPDALKVLYRLARNNYTAYLVGGGVRDLLLGRVPKDFDISTDAKPEQIRSLFRNCILIGRRFRLAHIRYGEKIIETSTFRTSPKQQADPTDPEADLFQRDDNLFGSPAEDAIRRDFTVNGLFYDIESFSIIDYVGGMEDLSARRIRCIGDPCIRFREDPVRMVRAVRFASRLDFSLDPGTEAAIHQYGPELTKASPARLLEEITRLFAFSVGEKAVRLLRSTGLLNVILPEVDVCLDSDKVNQDLFWKRLRALDCGDTVLPDATPALIFAVLLWDSLKMYLGKSWDFQTTPRLRFDKLYSFMQPLAQRLRFPKKLVDRIIHMYLNQNRFSGNSALRGKPGSLSNFVTQEAFHESLALAEIILSAEGGEPTRLNHWREMLQERIYGREEIIRNGHHHNGIHNGTGNAGNNGGTVPTKGGNGKAVGNNEGGEAVVVAVEVGECGESEATQQRLSRSARRRRNKRLRRVNQREKETSALPAVGAEGQDENRENASAAPVQTADASVPHETEKRSGGEQPSTVKANSRPGRSRNIRSGRKGAAKIANESESNESVKAVVPETDAVVKENADASPSSVVEKTAKNVKEVRKRGGRGSRAGAHKSVKADESGGGEADRKEVEAVGPPPKPLTASAFWKEPESESAQSGEKKRRGRGGKSGGAKRKESASSKEEKASPVDKPLEMDKADEADIPMHWLDEI